MRRQEGRRRLRLLVTVVAVSAAVAGGWVASRSPLLDVDRVAVVGAVRTERGELLQAAGIRLGQAMVDVDERGAERRVARLPWVAAASVQRRWPGTVRVQVTEREPVAAVAGGDGGWALVDASGQVLGVAGHELDTAGPAPAGVPVLEGVAPAGPAGTPLGGSSLDLLIVAATLPPELADRVAAVAPAFAADGGGVELRLHGGARVRLGPPVGLAEKYAALRVVLEGVDTSHLAVLDVRVPESPALTRLNPVGKVSTHGIG